MNYEKKQIIKTDGRILIFYHFKRTATTEQTLSFLDIDVKSEQIHSSKAENIV